MFSVLRHCGRSGLERSSMGPPMTGELRFRSSEKNSDFDSDSEGVAVSSM